MARQTMEDVVRERDRALAEAADLRARVTTLEVTLRLVAQAVSNAINGEVKRDDVAALRAMRETETADVAPDGAA